MLGRPAHHETDPADGKAASEGILAAATQYRDGMAALGDDEPGLRRFLGHCPPA